MLVRAILLVAIFIPGVCAGTGGNASGFNLKLEVYGVRNGKGVIGVLVFQSAEGWPEDTSRAFRAVSVPAHPNLTVVTVPGLPPGSYSVVVLHDENENRKLDRNWLGVPKEQWGMSRNPRAGLSAPAFRRAQFGLSGDLTLRIQLQDSEASRD
jgi:uncharacterized protein (DUF2141 family)